LFYFPGFRIAKGKLEIVKKVAKREKILKENKNGRTAKIENYV